MNAGLGISNERVVAVRLCLDAGRDSKMKDCLLTSMGMWLIFMMLRILFEGSIINDIR